MKSLNDSIKEKLIEHIRDWKPAFEVDTVHEVLSQVYGERAHQEIKWDEQNHSPIEWLAILTEEVGEAAKEAVDWHFRHPVKHKGSSIPATTADQYHRLLRYRKELIQVAAVAVQMIECVDRNELKNAEIIEILQSI